jgi:hypothetical protein
LELFDRHGLLGIIRAHYGTLHTQRLDESAAFAEDVLADWEHEMPILYHGSNILFDEYYREQG